MRVYEYGLRWPIHNETLVDDQIRLAHRYRNTLTEIERTRRTESRSILGAHDDVECLLAQVAEIAAERDAARDRIRLGRAATRSKSESAVDRELVRELGVRLKELRAQAKEAKRRIAQDPEIRGALDVVTEHAQQRRRDERKASGVYWGTYLLIEEAADQAAKSKLDPRFVRFAGDGRVGVQIQGGIDVGELAADTRALRVETRISRSRDGHH